jgi:NhaP-type Na+/H+ or K+/H+ antiporter
VTSDIVFLVAGGGLLLAVLLPGALHRWAVSAPLVLMGVGVLVGLTPLPDGLPIDPTASRATIEHVTEVVVLVALMGVGLAIDRPLHLRSRASWRSWGATWRMLGIAMPLTIAAVAVGAWSLGVSMGAALLLGAVLAPTDPVLASDVQVAGPSEDEEADEREVRFTLTSEAGLNDGLAFPFVYAAILVAEDGFSIAGLGTWVALYLVAKTVLGVVAGVVLGRLLAALAFRTPSAPLRVAERGDALFVLAALALAYGAGELVGGYGFLSVFCCALTIRAQERGHRYHRAMHDVTERLERLLTLFVLMMLGIGISRGLLGALDWRGVVIALGLLLVVRPLAGVVALRAHREDVEGCSGLTHRERLATAFFGVRGVGSLFYLAYAAGEVGGFDLDWLWSTVAFTVVASVVVHGVLATPVMRRLEADAEAALR